MQIQPPPTKPQLYLMENYAYKQPEDHTAYPHAPGALRICYPTATFWEDEVAVTYDYGNCPEWDNNKHTTKIKIVTLDWLYERDKV